MRKAVFGALDGACSFASAMSDSLREMRHTTRPAMQPCLRLVQCTASRSTRACMPQVAHVRNASGSNFSLMNNNPDLNNDNLDNPLPGHSPTGGYIGINPRSNAKC
jgi:hypothetical protein